MEKLKLAKKAFKLEAHRIDEGHFLSDKVVYADSLGKAKQLILSDIKYDDYKIRHTLEPVTYLNIPVVRAVESDKFEFENELLPMWKIHEIKEERKRIAALDLMLSDEKIKYCYIKKGYYYRPNSNGYTEYLAYAGVYTVKEAVATAKGCRDLSLIPINIEEHNAMINEKILDLQTRVISLQ